MLRHRTYPSGGVGRIAVLALTAVIVVALSLVLTCSAMDIPLMQPKLENATVDPGTTITWDQSFTYTVNCIFSDEVNITLEFYNLSEHEWTTVSAKPYTNISKLETLTWDNVKLCSRKCEGTSSYRFLYNNSIQITKPGPAIAAPSVTVVKLFKNATLNPTLGLWDDSYNYSVDVTVSEEASIQLDVYDVGSGRWKAAGSEVYTNKSGRLVWTNVTPFSFDSTGLASYRFVDLTHNHESGIYYGPILNVTGKEVVISGGGGGGGGGGISWRRLLEDEKLQKELAEALGGFNISGDGGGVAINPPELINPTVTPERGSWHQSYDYCVVVEHPNRAAMWLTLEVYCPGKGVTHIVSNKEISTYNETYLFNWNIVSRNDSKEELKRALNDNFNIDWMEDANISNSGEIINIYTDNHSAELIMDEEEEKATLKISDGRTYELKVKTEDDKLKIYYETNRAKVEWPGVNVFSEEDVRANESPRYYIHYNDGCNKNSWGLFPGPELYFTPVLTDPSVSPEKGTYKEQFVYKVDVMDEEGDDVNVTLYIVDSGGNKKYNETHVINGSEAKGGITESWIYKFTEEAADTEFRYYFSATDGKATNTTSEIRVGPYIKPGPIGTPSWIYPELLVLVIGLIVGLLSFSVISLIKSKKVPLVKSKQDFESWLSSVPEDKIEEMLKVLKKLTPQVSRGTEKEKIYETLMSYYNKELTFEELKEQLRGKRIIEEEI